MRKLTITALLFAIPMFVGCGNDKNSHFTNLSSRGALEHKNESNMKPLKQNAKLDDNKSSSSSKSKESRSKDSVQFEPVDKTTGAERVPSRSAGSE